MCRVEDAHVLGSCAAKAEQPEHIADTVNGTGNGGVCRKQCADAGRAEQADAAFRGPACLCGCQSCLRLKDTVHHPDHGGSSDGIEVTAAKRRPVVGSE